MPNIRATRIEVGSVVGGEWRDVTSRWFEHAEQCQEITNWIWTNWWIWHQQNDSAGKLKAHFAAYREWESRPKKQRKKAGKPKWPVIDVPKELAAQLRADVEAAPTSRWPLILGRCRALLLQKIVQRIKAVPAANGGNLPGWVSILFGKQNIPSTERGNPIPFDRANSSLVHNEKGHSLRVRFTAIPREGKSADSIQDEVTLRTDRKRAKSQAKILDRIIAGGQRVSELMASGVERDKAEETVMAEGGCIFKGSTLSWNSSRRKWFVGISYKQPSPEASSQLVNPDVRATMFPGRDDAVVLVCGDRAFFPLGKARHIPAIRKSHVLQLYDRRQLHRHHPSSARTGHGRKRASRPQESLRKSWGNFVKTANERIAREAIKRCMQMGAGTLRFLQPCGDKRDTRYLVYAGKQNDVFDATGWDWYGLAKRLKEYSECIEISGKKVNPGIGIEIVKVGEPQKVSA